MNRGQGTGRCIGIAGLVVLTACSGTGKKYPPPAADMAARQPIAPYRVKVGDTLGVRFYKTPELNVDVPVRSDGRISIPPLGDVDAAGKTPQELAGVLSERYSSELTNPRVTIIVQTFGGQVFVTGEVKTPGGPWYASGLTALQAIALSGGFLDTAKLDNVVLIRREGDAYHGYRLALNKVLSGDDVDADVRLQPGDIVHVPKSKIADVNMFVKLYIRENLPIQPGLTLPVF